MDDRELIELAAKVYGFGAPNTGEFCWTESEYPRGSGKHGALWNYVGWLDEAELWNPLADDGDALRLAVKLHLDLQIAEDGIDVIAVVPPSYGIFWTPREFVCDRKDANEAMRYAIVRAAAKIGAIKDRG